ncbi:MAG: helix-turn-helix domain-containing protein [Bosea sp. (in: a-proteobacteria)]
MDRIEAISLEISRRLRSARKGAGLTLNEVADKSGLSQGFLSRLERGQAAASLANLIQLTDVLGLGMHELFVENAAPARTRIWRHSDADSQGHEVESTGYRWRHLGGGAPLDTLEVFQLVFPLDNPMTAMVSHPGQEHCYVLSGAVNFYVGGESHHLAKGDGIFIDSELPHRAENAGPEEAHVLMTVSRPPQASSTPEWWRVFSREQEATSTI